MAGEDIPDRVENPRFAVPVWSRHARRWNIICAEQMGHTRAAHTRQTLEEEKEAGNPLQPPLDFYCSSIMGCSRRALSQLRSFCSACASICRILSRVSPKL
jgi:hypothetical protein